MPPPARGVAQWDASHLTLRFPRRHAAASTVDRRKDACSCNAQLLGGVIDISSLPSLQCWVRFWGHNEASSPYAGCTGLHFDSTTVALPALTTINKCLIFLEREKSIGRLRTSRQPTTASR